jgi:hypothetical protein
MRNVNKMNSSLFNKIFGKRNNVMHFKGGLTFKVESARLNNHRIKVLRPTKNLSFEEGLKIARKISRSR